MFRALSPQEARAYLEAISTNPEKKPTAEIALAFYQAREGVGGVALALDW